MPLSCRDWQVPWTGEAYLAGTPQVVIHRSERIISLAVSFTVSSHILFLCVKTKTSFIFAAGRVSSQVW